MSILYVSSSISLSNLNDKDLVLVDASNSSITVKLPFATEVSELTIRKTDLSSNFVTITTKGIFDTISHRNEIILSEYDNSAVIISDGNRSFFLKDNIPISIFNTEADGGLHIYVSKSGSNSNIGTSVSPLLTFQEAISVCNNLVTKLQSRGEKKDIIIEMSPGKWDENIKWNIPAMPSGRIIVRGDKNLMTPLFSGTLTSGSSGVFTDISASFGLSDEIFGKIITTWTGSNQNQQWFTIGAHDNTNIKIVTVASPVPTNGWNYCVYEPSTWITSSVVQDSRDSVVEIYMPWNASIGREQMSVNHGPVVLFEFMGIELTGTTSFTRSAMRINGGVFGAVGLVIKSNDDGLRVKNSQVWCGQLQTNGLEDLIHNLAATDSKIRGLSVGIINTNGTAGLYTSNCEIRGAPVIKMGAGLYGIYAGFLSRIYLDGGSIHQGQYCIISSDGAQVTLRRGFGDAAPFKISGSVGHGIRADLSSQVTIYTVEFEKIGACCLSGRAFSTFYLSDATALSTAKDVAQYIISLDEQSKAVLSTNIVNTNFSGAIGELQVDAVTGSMASVATGTSLLGLGGSRISRFPG